MAPARMSDRARALIAEYTEDYIPTPMLPEQGDLEHRRFDAGSLSVVHSIDGGRNRALAARRAMEVVNALACCRGFSVEENPGFWRRLIDEHQDDGIDCAFQLRLAPGTMSRHQLGVNFTQPLEAMAFAIVLCLTNDPASEAMRARKEIHTRLQGFLVHEPPMVDIQTSVDWYEFSHVRRNRGRTVKRVLLQVQRLCRKAMALGVKERVPIVFDRKLVEEEELLELAECVLLPCVELRELTVKVEMEQPGSIASKLSTLIRELVRANTVRKMTWEFKRCDHQCLAAIFSAIPSMTTLASFTVKCIDLNVAPSSAQFGIDMESYYLYYNTAYSTTTWAQGNGIERNTRCRLAASRNVYAARLLFSVCITGLSANLLRSGSWGSVTLSRRYSMRRLCAKTEATNASSNIGFPTNSRLI